MRYNDNFRHQHAIGKSAWHMEWCTKYRYKVFKSDYNKNICVIALKEAAKKAKVAILDLEVQSEHVHLLVELPLTMSPLEAVRGLKSVSAKIIFALLPNLRLRYPRGEIWSTGKFAISVGNITLEKAKEYVKNQKAHHAKNSLVINRNPSPVAKRRGRPAGRGLCPWEEVNIFLNNGYV